MKRAFSVALQGRMSVFVGFEGAGRSGLNVSWLSEELLVGADLVLMVTKWGGCSNSYN